MPKRLSIEIIEHSDNDVRLIIKDNNETKRLKLPSRACALHVIGCELCGDVFKCWRP